MSFALRSPTPAGHPPASTRAAASLRYAPSFIIGEVLSPGSVPLDDSEPLNLSDGPRPTVEEIGS